MYNKNAPSLHVYCGLQDRYEYRKVLVRLHCLVEVEIALCRILRGRISAPAINDLIDEQYDILIKKKPQQFFAKCNYEKSYKASVSKIS